METDEKPSNVCPTCGYEFVIEDNVREEIVEEDGFWIAREYLVDGTTFTHHKCKL